MSFAIIIASHGDERWAKLALDRAFPSATRQGDTTEILIGHASDANRAEVRNLLAYAAEADWLVFLDADDELAPGYIAAMTRAAVDPATLLVPRRLPGGLPLDEGRVPGGA